jgi:hypothetical protein
VNEVGTCRQLNRHACYKQQCDMAAACFYTIRNFHYRLKECDFLEDRDSIKCWVCILCTSNDNRYLTWEGERIYQTKNWEAEIFPLLGYYATFSGNSLPKFRHQLSFPSSTMWGV